MKQRHYNIKFPAFNLKKLGQDETFFYLKEDGEQKKLRFHEYGELYSRPGLYEQLFYQRLKCASPQKICSVLSNTLQNNRAEMSELRVLDLGAGNGMVGELLDTARVVGIDISEEASMACDRDRPGAYDAYYVTDLCNLQEDMREELLEWNFDCLTCVAALGFGDIPTKAFAAGFNLIQTGGWVAFNVKETFLQESDQSGFSRLVKHLLLSDTLEIDHMERYRHRISIDGGPLFYYVIVGQKKSDIPESIIAEFE